MKTVKFLTVAIALVAFFAACQKAEQATEQAVEDVTESAVSVWESDANVAKAVIEEGAAEVAEAPAGATTYTVDLAASKLEWKGSKLAYSHNGTIDLQSGSLSIDSEGNLVGGSFVIDMSTIKDLDLEDPEKIAKLEGHLKSEDFFQAETYPTATFTLTNYDAGTGMVSGNLEMKGKTHQITFPATVNVTDNGVEASARSKLIVA